jgi:hypothetical protein
LLLALAVAACALERATAPDTRPENARLDADWGGQDWRAVAHAYLVPGDSLPRLIVTAFHSYGREPVGEWLNVAVPFAGPGEYVLDESDVWVDILVSEDESFGGFQGSRPTPGALRIDAYDQVTQVIRGSAEFSVVGTRSGLSTDTMRVNVVRFVAPLTLRD